MNLNLMSFYDYTMTGNPYIFTISLMLVFFEIRGSGRGVTAVITHRSNPFLGLFCGVLVLFFGAVMASRFPS
jgi:hypothetical protein